jgi:hypothetical protein
MLAPLSVLPASADNNVVTSDTVALMRDWSHWAAGHEPVWRATCEALSRARVGFDAPSSAKAGAVHSWITRRGWRCLFNWLTGESRCLSFLPHEDLLQQLGFTGQEQLMIPPYLFLAFGSGDCPMYAMLTASMLSCAGVPWVMTTLAADRRDPARWSHVYTSAILEDGSYLPCDTAAAAQRPELGLGWEAAGFRRADWVM